MKRLLTASALALAVVAPLSAYAASENYSFSNGGGSGRGVATSSCQYVDVQVFVARAGTHNLNAPGTNGVAVIDIGFEDFCTGTFFTLNAYTTNFQFNAPGAPSGIPQSIKASGTAPANCYSGAPPGCPSPTDTVTFSVDFQSIGAPPAKETAILHFTQADGITTDEHMDQSFVPATGTVTLSTANLGTIQISNWTGLLNDEKTHTVSITH